MACGRAGGTVSLSIGRGPDAVAAAAILLSVCLKAGARRPPRAGGDLFDAPAPAAGIRLAVAPDRLDIDGIPVARRAPLSLSSLALMAADAVFVAGALDYPADFVAFDFETTGRNPVEDEITEIGAVKVEAGRETAVFSSFVKPRRPIPPEVVGITGITDEMVAGAPPPAEALARFLDFAGALPLVAHNTPFDIGFLSHHARTSLGREVRPDTEDTLLMARWLFPEAPGHRLGDVAAIAGVALPGWHRAENDARAVAGIYLRLIARDREERRDLRLKEYCDLAALGTIASGLPLEGENGLVVKRGLGMMLRRFGPLPPSPPPARGAEPPPERTAERLLSPDDGARREAALILLAGLGGS
ncbi:MAG: 3'-5' exonuclease [bacterium]|nr:3'-5' exonuclease [bacterium]